MGDRRQTEVALDKGRRLLASLPYPENLDDEIIQAHTDFGGQERASMRLAGSQDHPKWVRP
jgi:hypothetical protein